MATHRKPTFSPVHRLDTNLQHIQPALLCKANCRGRGPIRRRHRRGHRGHRRDDIVFLRDVARVTAGLRAEFGDEAVVYAKLANENLRFLWGLVEKTAAEKQLTLEVKLADELPRLNADQRAVRQMLLNLLSNAIKFTLPGGSVSLAIAMKADRLTIAVEDTGIGISPADMPRLFQLFQQLDGSSSRKYGGLGLGLALSRQLAVSMGGDVGVAATLMATTPIVMLPIVHFVQREPIGWRAVAGAVIATAGVGLLFLA